MPARLPADVVAPVRSDSIDLLTASIDRYHRNYAPDRHGHVRRTSRRCRGVVAPLSRRSGRRPTSWRHPQICGSTDLCIHSSMDPQIRGSTDPWIHRSKDIAASSWRHRAIVAPSLRRPVPEARASRRARYPQIFSSVDTVDPQICGSTDAQICGSTDLRRRVLNSATTCDGRGKVLHNEPGRTPGQRWDLRTRLGSTDL